MIIEQIYNTPVLIKILLTLTLILALNTLTKKLMISLIMGALLLAFWTGQSIASIMTISAERSFSLNNLLLLLAVCQVMWLSRQMQISGIMEDMVSHVRQKVPKRSAMAILPAIIGFLPMPGGALFSAPMLQSCDPHNNTDSSIKAMTNHWFRHVWECWWPMYPGVLLTMELTGFDVPQMLALGLPISLAAILFGYLLLLRRIPNSEKISGTEKIPESSDRLRIIKLLMPIIVVIGVYAAVRLTHGISSQYISALPGLNRYLPMTIGLFAAMLYLQKRRPLTLDDWKNILLSKKVLDIVLIVLVVQIYGAFIEAESPHGYYITEQMRAELSNWGIPLMVIIMTLPFITAIATGMATGYIGASFPIILSLIGPDPSFGEMLSMLALAYGFGYMGFILSPVHVCLVVTCKHFDSPMLKNIAGLLPPAFLILIFSVGLSMFWSAVLT